jgi:hypothetical protein
MIEIVRNMRQICKGTHCDSKGRRGKHLDELESLGMGDIWENGTNNDKNVWVRISKRCNIERHSTEVTTREKLINIVRQVKKQQREGVIYRYIQERSNMMENGCLEMKEVRRNSIQGICPICSKGEGWNHILRCEGTRF